LRRTDDEESGRTGLCAGITPQPVVAVLEKQKFGCWYDTVVGINEIFRLQFCSRLPLFCDKVVSTCFPNVRKGSSPGRTSFLDLPCLWRTPHFSIQSLPETILPRSSLRDTGKQTGMFPILNAKNILDYRRDSSRQATLRGR
jgi:hypothetical protein